MTYLRTPLLAAILLLGSVPARAAAVAASARAFTGTHVRSVPALPSFQAAPSLSSFKLGAPSLLAPNLSLPSLKTANSALPSVLIQPSAAIAAPSGLKLAIPAAEAAAAPAAANAPEALHERLGKHLRKKAPLGIVYDGRTRVRVPVSAVAATDDLGPEVAFLKKVDRNSIHVTERAIYEIQREVDSLYAELSEIHSAEKQGLGAALGARKKELLAQLDGLFASVPGPQVSDRAIKTLSRNLKEAQAARTNLYNHARGRRWQDAGLDLVEFNRRAVELNLAVLKLQLQTARLHLRGKTNLGYKSFRRNAALWTLLGAYNSAVGLKSEIRFRDSLENMEGKVREYRTLGQDGIPIRVFELPGFDIELLGGTGEKPQVSVRQQRWRNVLTVIEEAARDARNGRAAEAEAAIDEIMKLYTVDYRGEMDEGLSRRYLIIGGALMSLKHIATKLKTAEDAAYKSGADEFTRAATRIPEIIPHPKLSMGQNVAYEGLDTALRSQAHTLDSNIRETEKVLRHVADLEYAAEIIAASLPHPQRKLVRKVTKRELKAIAELVDGLHAWTQRGFVRQKQAATGYLATAARGLETGDLKLAQKFIEYTAQILRERVDAMSNISSRVRVRAAAIYAEFRDQEINRRVGGILGALDAPRRSRKLIDSLIAEIQLLRLTYFENALPEPGYRRAAAQLERLPELLDRRRYMIAAEALLDIQNSVRDKLLN